MNRDKAAAAWSQMTAVTEQRRRQALGLPTPSDLVQRLRDRAYSGLPDPLSEQAAQEIERLRLTAAERDVVEFVVAEGRVACGAEADVLRGMLERLSPIAKCDKSASESVA